MDKKRELVKYYKQTTNESTFRSRNMWIRNCKYETVRGRQRRKKEIKFCVERLFK